MKNRIHRQFPKVPQVGDVLSCKTRKTYELWKKALRDMGYESTSKMDSHYFWITITGKRWRLSQDEMDRIGALAKVERQKRELSAKLDLVFECIDWTNGPLVKRLYECLDEFINGGSR